ncbi:MAG: helix-turn-helix domain-containing protein [Sporichthyaceae bacterium]|nr:helix-turn-helix domain-containing protein [Sporichthyaceae bacterium]
MTEAQPERGSTVRRILLGVQLKRLREAAGVSRRTAGYTIRASESKMSRLELGRVGFKERDVVDLLTLYGVTDDSERETLLALAREANTPGWWHTYSDVLPSWFQVYVGLEGAASLIRTYEVQFVPGLLQTEDYARAVAQRGQPDELSDELERRIDARMTRQRLLARPDPPRLWAVVDEAVLRRPIGGSAVMRAQLEHLIACARRPNITIQVMPFRFGGHAGESGPFSILRFAEPDLTDVVYIEQLSSALYLDKAEDVDLYLDAMERMCAQSVQPDRTATLLKQILQET